jgi:hypothetical protein
MKKGRSLIRLSDNPYGGDEDPLDPTGGELGGDDEEEEAPFGEEAPEEDEMSGMYSMRKGRRVSGPRVKLSLEKLDNRMTGIERAVVDLAETVSSLAQSNSVVGKAVLARLRKDDEKDEEDEKEDKASLRKDYASDTGIGDTKDVGDDRTSEEETKNEVGITEGDLTKNRRLAKDDAASSFGEKDDDMPGNKPAGIDEKDKSPEDYLLQGGASDGPGPTVSAALKADLAKAAAAVYARHGIVMKASGPRPGTGGSEPTTDVDDLFARARNMSFRELNRKRVEVGDLPDGLI